MPDTITPRLGLIKPEVGASRDTWGTKTNGNWDVVDDILAMAMPIGAVLDFAGPNAPDGWLICDGRLLSRTTYSALFAVIGTYWGSGDGSTTFALPPTPGRSCVGPGSVIDETGATVTFAFATHRGAVARPIAQANLPALTMTTDAIGAHVHNVWTGGAGAHAHSTDAQGAHAHSGSWASDHAHNGYTDAQGAHAHNITLPATSAGTSGGGYNVMSPVFGNSNYVTDTQGSHSHNVATYGSGILGVAIVADGSHAHTVYGVGDHTHGAAMDAQGGHSHSVSLGGSGTWLDTLSPVLVTTKIIYAGAQASSRTLTLMSQGAGPMRVLASPMRGRH